MSEVDRLLNSFYSKRVQVKFEFTIEFDSDQLKDGNAKREIEGLFYQVKVLGRYSQRLTILNNVNSILYILQSEVLISSVIA